MKKTGIVFLTICLAAALSACSLNLPIASGKTAPDPSDPPIQTPIPETPKPQKTPEEIYAPVIRKYKSAVAAKMNAENLVLQDLNYMTAYCYGDVPLDSVGYVLHDLEGNGIPELLIGSRTGDEYQDKIVLDLYAIKDGQCVRVFQSGERQRYYLCSDGSFANENSSSAFESSRIRYGYSDGEMLMQETVIFDMNADRVNPWFYEADGKKTGIPETEALAKMSAWEKSYVIINYTPLSQF